MLHVIEACKSLISREARLNDLIHTIGRVMIILYMMLQQQLATEAKPRHRLS